MNEKAEFATKTLQEYARQQGFSTRSTSDLSTLEEWLIAELLRVQKLPIQNVSNNLVEVCKNDDCKSESIIEFLGRNKRQCQVCGDFWKTDCQQPNKHNNNCKN